MPDLDWSFTYNLFQLAGICQGIAGRVRDGAAHPQATLAAKRVVPRATTAIQFAKA